ncbi:hypothetical protein FEM54_29165 [Pseudomonas edaphica]|uniref:tRNA_anti-like n=1 Tax=Pseudomonas edaphica TaxID=2006980 RepID=A0ABY2TX14_9PSED|nr:hypothetical protein [Pseudomonas edaphica]TLG87789.1 hypothetical protein FEM54_29165 [Pseudomonas edaphica]
MIKMAKKRMTQGRALSALLLLCSFTGSPLAYAEDVERIDFDQLYEAFLNNDNSSLELPQYQKRLLISGVVLRNSVNFSGNPLLTVTSLSSDSEMARMTSYDAGQAEKMKNLQAGDEFKAICILGPTVGGSSLSLRDCVLK